MRPRGAPTAAVQLNDAVAQVDEPGSGAPAREADGCWQSDGYRLDRGSSHTVRYLSGSHHIQLACFPPDVFLSVPVDGCSTSYKR